MSEESPWETISRFKLDVYGDLPDALVFAMADTIKSLEAKIELAKQETFRVIEEELAWWAHRRGLDT